ncbi:MAG: hypothetical protein HQ519_07715 [Planctomycetes bacterium]|nr:hypothetical protein [Planctomycetota bacterium]
MPIPKINAKAFWRDTRSIYLRIGVMAMSISLILALKEHFEIGANDASPFLQEWDKGFKVLIFGAGFPLISIGLNFSFLNWRIHHYWESLLSQGWRLQTVILPTALFSTILAIFLALGVGMPVKSRPFEIPNEAGWTLAFPLEDGQYEVLTLGSGSPPSFYATSLKYADVNILSQRLNPNGEPIVDFLGLALLFLISTVFHFPRRVLPCPGDALFLISWPILAWFGWTVIQRAFTLWDVWPVTSGWAPWLVFLLGIHLAGLCFSSFCRSTAR